MHINFLRFFYRRSTEIVEKTSKEKCSYSHKLYGRPRKSISMLLFIMIEHFSHNDKTITYFLVKVDIAGLLRG